MERRIFKSAFPFIVIASALFATTSAQESDNGQENQRESSQAAEGEKELGSRKMRVRSSEASHQQTTTSSTRIELENDTTDQRTITVLVVHANGHSLYAPSLRRYQYTEANLYRGVRGVVVYDSNEQIILCDQFEVGRHPLLVQVMGSAGNYRLAIRDLP